MLKNFDFSFEGIRNMWKIHPQSIQWFSSSLETGVENKAIVFVSAHLWLFGFQIFEVSIYRKK